MRDLHEINMNEGGKPVGRNPPTAAQVSEFQSHFGVVLPESYLIFLKHSNGGHPERNAYLPKGCAEDHLWGVNRFYYLNDDKAGVDGLWNATQAWRNALRKDIVPIADDGGGNRILLSFAESPPSVKVCIHDEGMRFVHAADSFEEFIDSLTDDPDMI